MKLINKLLINKYPVGDPRMGMGAKYRAKGKNTICFRNRTLITDLMGEGVFNSWESIRETMKMIFKQFYFSFEILSYIFS